jgi:8-oxo-dGTP diphosphatase
MDHVRKPAYPAFGVSAKGIVQRRDGSVLIIKRSPESRIDPSCWDLPGGKMDYGERLVDTLAREVLEETGLTVVATRPFMVSHFNSEQFWVTCVTFLCEPAQGEVHVSGEHREHEWIWPRQLDDRTYARSIRGQLEAFAALPESTTQD